jgi:2-desacetyl-2-hydroxyethyl bacteriochlorophyllide A dehydrogenase
MNGQAIVFESVGKVGLREYEVPQLTERDVLAETVVSAVSAGTERWAFIGKRKELTFPNVPGYMAIARVTHVGTEAKSRGYAEGQFINLSRARIPEPLASNSWMGSHLSHAVVDVCVPPWQPGGFNGMHVERLPSGLDMMQASLTQLASVALRGIEMATVPMGATVLICGLGVIGLYATQICRLKGAIVTATDVIPSRLKLAAQYGAQHVVDGSKEDLAARSREIEPQGYDIIIDTSSIPAVVNGLFPLLKLWGKFVFQGWYPPPSAFDFNALHLRMATCYVPCGHSGRGTAAAMAWAAEGKLDTKSMISHVVAPAECKSIYELLADGSQELLGAVFDWTKL